MKRKYYLRGLAVGIILTTLILSIANADNRPMTDAEIRQRASELGMVESDSLKLTDVAESSDSKVNEESSGKYNPSIAVLPSNDEADSLETGSLEVENTESESIATENVESANLETDSLTTESITGAADGSVPPASESVDVSEPLVLTIKNGDTSYSVSKTLAAAGLVEDAAEFDSYLCDNGYSRKIRTGTYEIIPGMSYEEIAKVISR